VGVGVGKGMGRGEGEEWLYDRIGVYFIWIGER
jgi:hypothetical protein